MKVSELIEFLNGVIDEHGDMYLENEQGVLSTREQWEEAFRSGRSMAIRSPSSTVK